MEHHRQRRQHGKQENHPHRHAPIKPQHARRASAHDGGCPEGVKNHPRRNAAHLAAVGGDPRDQPSRRSAVKVAKLQLLKPRKRPLTQRKRQSRADSARRTDKEEYPCAKAQRQHRPGAGKPHESLAHAMCNRLINHGRVQERSRRFNRGDTDATTDQLHRGAAIF